MPSLEHRAYQTYTVDWFRKHGHEADVEPLLRRYKESALLLYHFDLELARKTLAACYSPAPRGNPPTDPIILLRGMLLAALIGQKSINKWVADLGAQRIFRVLAGLPVDKKRPGVGTFYDYLHRIHDGPTRYTCQHVEQPSHSERRRARTPRRLKRRAMKGKEKASERQKRARRRQKRHAEAQQQPPEEIRSATERLALELKLTLESDNPNDLLDRLASILIDTAVMESARKGLLGDYSELIVSGDGSKLRSGANQHGKRVCQHEHHQRCDCEKLFSDPDAVWGWDSLNEQWFFGHHFYEISCSTQGHDLPLAITLAPGNESDYTASLRTVDHLIKSMNKRLGGSWRIAVFIADAGHDAEAIHRYLIDLGVKTIIPLKAPARATHPNRPDLFLSPRGVPLCQAGVEMTHWGSAGKGRVNFLCPVRAGKLERCPLTPDEQPDWHCRPHQRFGPTTTVKTEHNPRLFPALPRNSPTYKELYKLRSGCERSNAVKKETFQLEAARHRRSSFWLIRLHLIAMLQHAKAWVAGHDADAHVDFLLGKTAGAKSLVA